MKTESRIRRSDSSDSSGLQIRQPLLAHASASLARRALLFPQNMKTIYKYSIQIADEQTINVPLGADRSCVGLGDFNLRTIGAKSMGTPA